MMARPVPSKEREARDSWKRSTETVNLKNHDEGDNVLYDNHGDEGDDDDCDGDDDEDGKGDDGEASPKYGEGSQ